MFQRLRASIMLTVITIGIFTVIDMFLDTGVEGHVYSLKGLLIIFGVAFVVAPFALRKFPLR